MEVALTRALLLHRGDSWTADLEGTLRLRYSLRTMDYCRQHVTKECTGDVELLVVDVSIDDPKMRAVLQMIRQVKSEFIEAVAIVCVSRVNRGPRFQHDIELLGARFVYA